MAGKLTSANPGTGRPMTPEEASAYCQGRRDAVNSVALDADAMGGDPELQAVYVAGRNSATADPAGLNTVDCCGAAYPYGSEFIPALLGPFQVDGAPDGLGLITYWLSLVVQIVRFDFSPVDGLPDFTVTFGDLPAVGAGFPVVAAAIQAKIAELS